MGPMLNQRGAPIRIFVALPPLCLRGLRRRKQPYWFRKACTTSLQCFYWLIILFVVVHIYISDCCSSYVHRVSLLQVDGGYRLGSIMPRRASVLQHVTDIQW